MVTPSMVKTESTDMETAEIGWMASNFYLVLRLPPYMVWRRTGPTHTLKNLMTTLYTGSSPFYYSK